MKKRINKTNKIAKLNPNKNNKNHFYYSFLTVVLLICLIQVGFSAILNISKIISYHSKISTMKKLRNEADIKNRNLRKSINEFSTTSTLEEIARNNLKMASEDEVLVIINEKKQVQTPKKVKNDKQ